MKAYLLSCLSILIINVARSQEIKPKFFISKMEIHAGISSVTQTGYERHGMSYNFKTGNILSIGLVHSFSKKWDVIGLVRWENKGSETYKDDMDSPYAGYNMTTNIQPLVPTARHTISDDRYLTFSIMPRYSLSSRWQIGIAPYFSILSNEASDYYVIQNGQLEFEQATKDYFIEGNDYGISLSIGCSFPITSKSKLSFQLLDNYGLKNLYGAYNAYGTSIRNSTLSLLIGFTFSR